MTEELIHRTAEHSWVSGRISSLCGLVREAGEYERLWVWTWGAPRCPECERIRERGY
ncbi:MAG: hypothetical protein ACRDRD_20765 [Pseudonocardiaceae bacterium]